MSAWHGVSALANLQDKVKLAATHSFGVLLASLSVHSQASLRCCWLLLVKQHQNKQGQSRVNALLASSLSPV